MATYFNKTTSTPSGVYTTTSGGTVWSSNLNSTASFDYFSDSAVVDDAIYIGFNGTTIGRGITVTIGTAFAATSVTFVWEYWDGNSWETLSVTDGTNNWTTTGEQFIDFIPPLDWANNYTGNSNALIRAYVVRCRISAIDTPTEGGANITNAIDVGDNFIWVDDVGVDYTFDDLYDLDVANSWGVIEKLSTEEFNIYKISACLRLQQGNFTSTNETVIFEVNCVFRNDYCNLTIGEKVSEYTGTNGSTWFFNSHPAYSTAGIALSTSSFSSATIGIYGSRIANIEATTTTTFNIYQPYSTANIELIDSDFQFRSTVGFYGNFDYDDPDNNIVVKNCRFVCNNVTMNMAPATFEKCQVSGNSSALRTNYGTDVVALEVASYGTPTYGGLYLYGFTGVFAVRNSPDIDLSDNRWQISSTTQTGVAREEYSLNLTVVDNNNNPIVGATVTVVDKNGDAITGSPFTTDGDGVVDCGYLLMRTATCSTPDATTSTSIMTSYNPYTVTITATNYTPRSVKYTMDRKREEVEKLTPDGTNIIEGTLNGNITIY